MKYRNENQGKSAQQRVLTCKKINNKEKNNNKKIKTFNFPESYLDNEYILMLYFKEISRTRPMSASEEYETAKLIKKGNKKALERLVKANLRFVVSVASTYQNQGMPLSDLISEGNLGLIKAAKRFDEKKNFKFISYAVWWIRQAILQSLANNSRIVRLPVNQTSNMFKIGKARDRLEQKYRRSVNIRELSEVIGVADNEIQNLVRIGNKHASLDASLRQGSTTTLIDIIHNEGVENQEENVMRILLNKKVIKLLDILNEREKMVIRYYYGINEDENYNLEDIGNHFGVSRERVRQIKEKAMTKLKRSYLTHVLKAQLH